MADVVLGIGIYDYIKTVISDPQSLAICALIASGLLATTLYLLDRWQLEYLTRRNK
jgi:hypothetical protein